MTRAKRSTRRQRLGILDAVKKAGAGRPSKYDPKFINAIDDFFAEEALERITARDGSVRHVYKNFPTIEGFALSIGVIPDTLHRWATETEKDSETPMHPEFTEAYARARARQKHMIQIGGLSGAYNSNMATLAAKNLLGWKDKTEVDSTVTLKGPTPEELDAIYSQKTVESAAMNAKVRKQAVTQPKVKS